LADGETPQSAAAIVSAEMAAGRAPGAQTGVTPLSGTPGSIDAVLDSIRDNGERSGNFAVSPAGARGRYQFMPGTAAQYGLTDPTNEAASRIAARRYITDLLRHFGSMDQAVAAYNWGPANLDSDIAKHGAQWASFLPRETSQYMAKVMGGVGASGGGSTTNIYQNGPVNISAPGGDPKHIARRWRDEVVAQANGGMQ
jgi:hypothetical protein